MEKPKLDWKTFTARRRLDVAAWISSKGFKAYAELKKWCTDRDMEPPAKSEVASYFKKPKKVPKPKEEPKPEPAVAEEKPAPKRRGRKKKIDTTEE